MALEVFSSDGRNQLLAFQRKIRNKVYHRSVICCDLVFDYCMQKSEEFLILNIIFLYLRFLTNATGIADSAQQSVAGQKRTANVEQTAGLLSNLIGETSVTQRWVVCALMDMFFCIILNLGW